VAMVVVGRVLDDNAKVQGRHAVDVHALGVDAVVPEGNRGQRTAKAVERKAAPRARVEQGRYGHVPGDARTGLEMRDFHGSDFLGALRTAAHGV